MLVNIQFLFTCSRLLHPTSTAGPILLSPLAIPVRILATLSLQHQTTFYTDMARYKGKAPRPASKASATTRGKETPSSKTTFLDLPAELRNVVYELALEKEIVVFTKLSKFNKNPHTRCPGLLLASKQVHKETHILL